METPDLISLNKKCTSVIFVMQSDFNYYDCLYELWETFIQGPVHIVKPESFPAALFILTEDLSSSLNSEFNWLMFSYSMRQLIINFTCIWSLHW